MRHVEGLEKSPIGEIAPTAVRSSDDSGTGQIWGQSGIDGVGECGDVFRPGCGERSICRKRLPVAGGDEEGGKKDDAVETEKSQQRQAERRWTDQGLACMVSEMRKRTRKKGGAVGSGRSSSGRNQRVHLLMSFLQLAQNKENILTTWLSTDSVRLCHPSSLPQISFSFFVFSHHAPPS